MYWQIVLFIFALINVFLKGAKGDLEMGGGEENETEIESLKFILNISPTPVDKWSRKILKLNLGRRVLKGEGQRTFTPEGGGAKYIYP